MPDVVRKVGSGSTLTPTRIANLKDNLCHAPKHRWERVARLIVAFEKGHEFETKELDYALETEKIVEKRMDNLSVK